MDNTLCVMFLYHVSLTHFVVVLVQCFFQANYTNQKHFNEFMFIFMACWIFKIIDFQRQWHVVLFNKGMFKMVQVHYDVIVKYSKPYLSSYSELFLVHATYVNNNNGDICNNQPPLGMYFESFHLFPFYHFHANVYVMTLIHDYYMFSYVFIFCIDFCL